LNDKPLKDKDKIRRRQKKAEEENKLDPLSSF
jgi:hypothetical protein